MKLLLLPFMALAGIGFALSVGAHVYGVLGQMPPGGQIVMGLHIGIFVVWLPTVLVATRTARGASRKDFWKIVLSGCPRWMRYALYVLFAYALLNFILLIVSTGGGHHASTGVTPETIRGFSGHWMIFYGMAFATLYSAIHAPHISLERKCSNGHPVSPADAYCPTCGRLLPKVPSAQLGR